MIVFDNAFHQGESQSPSATFGGKTGVEHRFEIFAWNALSGVLHQDGSHLLVEALYRDVDATLAAHSVDGIFCQVFHHPFKERLAEHHATVLFIAQVEFKVHSLGDAFAHIFE